MAEYIEKAKLIEYCKKCADVSADLYQKSLDNIGRGDSHASAFGAMAYFLQRESMYRYEIPGIVESFCMENGSAAKKPDGGRDTLGNDYQLCPNCCAVVEVGEWRASFCPDCGQPIDWGKNDGCA